MSVWAIMGYTAVGLALCAALLVIAILWGALIFTCYEEHLRRRRNFNEATKREAAMMAERKIRRRQMHDLHLRLRKLEKTMIDTQFRSRSSDGSEHQTSNLRAAGSSPAANTTPTSETDG